MQNFHHIANLQGQWRLVPWEPTKNSASASCWDIAAMFDSELGAGTASQWPGWRFAIFFFNISPVVFWDAHFHLWDSDAQVCIMCMLSIQNFLPNQHNSSAFCRCWNDVQDLFLKFLIRVRLVLGFAEYKHSTHFPEQLCFFYSTSNVTLVEIHHAQMPNAIGSRSFKPTNLSIRTEGSKSYSATYLPVPSWCLETRATENTVQTKVRNGVQRRQRCVLRFELICPDMSKKQSSQVAKWHVFFVHQNESSENMPRRIFNRTCATDPEIIHYVLQCCVLICFEVKISKQMKRHRNIEKKKSHEASTISCSLKSFGTCYLRW